MFENAGSGDWKERDDKNHSNHGPMLRITRTIQIPKCIATRTFEFSGWGKKDEWTRVKPSFLFVCLEVRQKRQKRVENNDAAILHFSRSPQLGCCETQLR